MQIVEEIGHMKEINFNIFDYKAHLCLDDSLTLIAGDSGIGKTLLFNYFDRQSHMRNDIKCINSRYVDMTCKKSNKQSLYITGLLKDTSGALVVIDNADILLTSKVREFIVMDSRNTYVLFGRNVTGLWTTENNIAELVRDDVRKRMYLNYYFKDVNKKGS